MSTADVFRRIADALERVGIPYMLTGSFASSYHGAPRATQDIDLVIAPTREQLVELVGLLPPSEYYVDLGDAQAALAHGTAFNVIDRGTGWKIDLIIRKLRAFSQEEFARRTAVEVFGTCLYVATAEDVVLAKLEWAKLGQSERQIQDVAELLGLRWDSLDHGYLSKWIDALGIRDEWVRARRRAGFPD